MTLHDELAHLTSAQPVQPGDRLASVTGKARRMKRTRNALVLAAVVAVAAPAGVLAATVERNPSATQFAGQGIDRWGDRSVAAYRAIEGGVLAAWTTEANGDASTVRWLYRNRIEAPGGEDTYLAVFRTPTTVFVGRAPANRVDESGYGYDSESAEGTVSAWSFVELSPTTAAKGISTYLTTIKDGELVQNRLFVLADPRARHLRWDSLPLESAPASDTSGEISSRDGVFLSDPVTLTGSVTYSVDDARRGPSASVGLGLEGSPAQLVSPAAPDTPEGFQVTGGGGGALDLDTGQGVYSSSIYGGTDTDPHARAFVRCYGGSIVSIRVNGTVRESVPCDDQTHEAVETGAVVPAGQDGSDSIVLRSDRLQVVRFVVGR